MVLVGCLRIARRMGLAARDEPSPDSGLWSAGVHAARAYGDGGCCMLAFVPALCASPPLADARGNWGGARLLRQGSEVSGAGAIKRGKVCVIGDLHQLDAASGTVQQCYGAFRHPQQR